MRNFNFVLQILHNLTFPSKGFVIVYLENIRYTILSYLLTIVIVIINLSRNIGHLEYNIGT